MENRIAELRKNKGLAQEELAKRANITRPYLSDIERGRKTPGAEIASKICRELGETFEDVFFALDVHHGGRPTGTAGQEGR